MTVLELIPQKVCFHLNNYSKISFSNTQGYDPTYKIITRKRKEPEKNEFLFPRKRGESYQNSKQNYVLAKIWPRFLKKN